VPHPAASRAVSQQVLSSPVPCSPRPWGHFCPGGQGPRVLPDLCRVSWTGIAWLEGLALGTQLARGPIRWERGRCWGSAHGVRPRGGREAVLGCRSGQVRCASCWHGAGHRAARSRLPGGRWGSLAHSSPRRSSPGWAAAPSGSSRRTWLPAAAGGEGQEWGRAGGTMQTPVSPHSPQPALPAPPSLAGHSPGCHSAFRSRRLRSHTAPPAPCRCGWPPPTSAGDRGRAGTPQRRVNWDGGALGSQQPCLQGQLHPCSSGRTEGPSPFRLVGGLGTGRQQQDSASHRLQHPSPPPWRAPLLGAPAAGSRAAMGLGAEAGLGRDGM